MGRRRRDDLDGEARMRLAIARLRVDERFRARAKLAETAPRRSLLPEGSSDLVTGLIRCYTEPMLFEGGYYTGIRLHFARMSDDEAWWRAMGRVSLMRRGDVFTLQPLEDTSASPLSLLFEGGSSTIERLRNESPRNGFPRTPSMRGLRLA